MTRYKSEMTSGFQVGNLRINKQIYGQQPIKADMPLVLTLDVFDEQQVLSKLESPSDLDQLIASVYTDTGLVFCRFERTGKRNGSMDTFQALLSGLPAGKYRSEIVIQRSAKTGASGVTMQTLRSYPLVVGDVSK